MGQHQRNEVRRLLLFAAAVLVLSLVALAYRPALHAGFIWDDHTLVQNDAPYRHASFEQLWKMTFWPESPFIDVRTAYFRPITLLSYRLDIGMGGEPREFHLTNLLLHLAACALVIGVAIRTGAKAGAAILASLVWGLAPRLTESVAWIAGRTDVLATVFGLSALFVSPILDAPGRPWSRLRAIASGFFLFCALCSKEVAFAFVITAIAFGFMRHGRGFYAAIATNVAPPLVVWFALRGVAVEKAPGGTLRELGVGARLATSLEAFERYVEMTFDALRPRTSIGMIGDLDVTRAVIGGVLLVAVIAVVALTFRRAAFGVRLGVLLALLALAPVLQLLPIALGGAIVADRLLYLPLAGLAIAIAVAASELDETRLRIFAGVSVLLAGFFANAVSARSHDYDNEAVFWVVAAENAHPSNAMPLRSLAQVVEETRENELACRLLGRARAMVRGQPASAPAVRRTIEGLARCKARIGRYEEAALLDEELVRDNPTNGRIRMELGFARLHVLDFDGAKRAFDEALKLDPQLAKVISKAQRGLERARRETPYYEDLAKRKAEPSQWAWHLADIGHLPEAVSAFTLVALDPELSPATRADAARFVAEEADLATATRVVAEVHAGAMELAVRQKRDERLRALRARCEQLAGDAPL